MRIWVAFTFTNERQSETLPLVPTHARIRFPEGSNGVANGKQENIWFWNIINTGAVGPGKFVFERTYILIIFSKPTSFPQLFIYQTGGGGREIPRFDIAQLDERIAEIVFYGSLSGFDLDITNQQR